MLTTNLPVAARRSSAIKAGLRARAAPRGGKLACIPLKGADLVRSQAHTAVQLHLEPILVGRWLRTFLPSFHSRYADGGLGRQLNHEEPSVVTQSPSHVPSVSRQGFIRPFDAPSEAALISTRVDIGPTEEGHL